VLHEMAPFAMKCQGEASSLDNERNSISPCFRKDDVLHGAILIDDKFETLLPFSCPLPVLKTVRMLMYVQYLRMLHKMAVVAGKAGNAIGIEIDEMDVRF
jgi:hypothetical protein